MTQQQRRLLQGSDSCAWCRDAILARKRAEYKDMVPQWYDIAGSSDDDAGALRQVPTHMQQPDLAAKYLQIRVCAAVLLQQCSCRLLLVTSTGDFVPGADLRRGHRLWLLVIETCLLCRSVPACLCRFVLACTHGRAASCKHLLASLNAKTCTCARTMMSQMVGTRVGDCILPC